MQKSEIEATLPIEVQHQISGINTETEVSALEHPFAKTIQELERGVYGIVDALNIAQTESSVTKELDIARNTYLVVGHEPGEKGSIYFYIASKPTSQSKNWYDHAVTCGHLVEYHWEQKENAPLPELKIQTWTIDPGGDAQRPAVDPSREMKVYAVPEASFSQLSDINTQFNKVVAHFEAPSA